MLGGTDIYHVGRWSDVAIVNILDLYKSDLMHYNMGLLAAGHWTRIWIEHIKQMPNELWRAKIHIKDIIEKLKPKYWCQNTLLKVKICGSGSTWCGLSAQNISWATLQRKIVWWGLRPSSLPIRETCRGKEFCHHNPN